MVWKLLTVNLIKIFFIDLRKFQITIDNYETDIKSFIKIDYFMNLGKYLLKL